MLRYCYDSVMIIVQRTAAEVLRIELQLKAAVKFSKAALSVGDKRAARLHALEAVQLQDQLVRSVVLDGQTA